MKIGLFPILCQRLFWGITQKKFKPAFRADSRRRAHRIPGWLIWRGGLAVAADDQRDRSDPIELDIVDRFDHRVEGLDVEAALLRADM